MTENEVNISYVDAGAISVGGPGKGEPGRNGVIVFHDQSAGSRTMVLSGTRSGEISINGAEGQQRIWITASDYGDIRILDPDGLVGIHLNGRGAGIALSSGGKDRLVMTGTGRIQVNNEDGDQSIIIDGRVGDIIFRNGDCAEEFEVAPAHSVCPGDVVILDEEGRLRACEKTYDDRAVGVVSGALGQRAALILGRKSSSSVHVPVALVGTVPCKVEAQSGEVKIGDLLTTSSVVGHAMRAADSKKRRGAIIGKALRSLPGGLGVIPVLTMLR